MPEQSITRHAFWFDDGKRPNVADVLEKAPGFAVHRMKFDTPDAQTWPLIRESHAYCITSTRQEVPKQYMCDADLIAKSPKLLMVYEGAPHSVSGAPSTNLGPYFPVFMADWTAARLAGKPMASERWFIRGSGEIQKTPL